MHSLTQASKMERPGRAPAALALVLAASWLTACLRPAVSPASSTPAAPAATPAPPATSTFEPTPFVPEATLPAPTPEIVTGQLPRSGEFALEPVIAGLDRPLYLTHAGDGSGRLFVVEKPGVIRVLRGSDAMPEPFLDIRDRVGSAASEQGLLGLAFHPRFAENGLFYVNYTDASGNTVVSRFVADPSSDQAHLASEKILLRINQPYANHNGGQLAFGPDGFLYVGVGDGGSAGDPLGAGQDLDTRLGKILRLDVDGGDPYAPAAGNPLLAGGGPRAEVWASGLRNPWRFSFDRATGEMWIGDVGQNQYEEIDLQPAGLGGLNYGWNAMEGLHAYQGGYREGMTLPVWEYDHSQGCSVTGGYVYRGQALTALRGVYLFGDYCSGLVWALARTPEGGWGSVELLASGLRLASFGEDEAGELYLVDLAGSVYSLVAG
jgi:glucose/arabinose dehydrogenase